jgi:hypothetical protein
VVKFPHTALATAILAAIFSAHSAGAAPDLGFGPTVVRGILVEAPPRTLYSAPDLFTTERVCGTFGDASGLIQDAANLAVSMANAEIQRRINGVELVRWVFTPSRRCTATASLGPNNQSISILVDLPGNRFESNVTTPNAPVIGGLPQGDDPRIYTTFDVHATVYFSLPSRAGECLGSPQSSVSIENISLPQGENFTGRLVGMLVDVGTSIYDHFKNGELGRTLGSGFQARAAIPGSAMASINEALCHGPVHYGTISTGQGPNQQLVISLAAGDHIVDARCIDGYVWRAERPDDLVCVTPQTRAQMKQDNAMAADRRIGQPDRLMLQLCRSGAGCDAAFRIACKPGFVWREAVANDYACVTPETRAQASDDNAQAARRRRDYVEVIK